MCKKKHTNYDATFDNNFSSELFNRYFSESQTHLSSTCLSSSLSLPNNNNAHVLELFSFANVSLLDVLRAFYSINATGYDGVTPTLIIHSTLPHVTYLINSILTTLSFPLCWKQALGNSCNPKLSLDFRPIIKLPILSKVTKKLWKCRLRHFCLIVTSWTNFNLAFEQSIAQKLLF